MTMPQTKTDLMTKIGQIESALSETVNAIPADQFDKGSSEAWSAASYLKHLILSIKPFAKALGLPKEQMHALFGQPDRPSRSYEELVAAYQERLDAGIRAEDFQGVTPVTYRFPEGTEDIKAYLLEVWHDAHNRLTGAMESWSDEDLDRYQLPHPALGLITLREMLFFTLHHNTLHWNDIKQTQPA